MGVVIGWDEHGHLTPKANLSTTLRVLQADLEVLLLLREVIIKDIHCYLQLTVARRKAQLTITTQKEQ